MNEIKRLTIEITNGSIFEANPHMIDSVQMEQVVGGVNDVAHVRITIVFIAPMITWSRAFDPEPPEYLPAPQKRLTAE